jgi:hypothetical protein
MQAGFPPVIVRTDMKGDYLLALEKADADGDLEPFIILIGETLVYSMQLYRRGAKGDSLEDEIDLDEKVARLKKKMADEDQG